MEVELKVWREKIDLDDKRKGAKKVGIVECERLGGGKGMKRWTKDPEEDQIKVDKRGGCCVAQ